MRKRPLLAARFASVDASAAIRGMLEASLFSHKKASCAVLFFSALRQVV